MAQTAESRKRPKMNLLERAATGKFQRRTRRDGLRKDSVDQSGDQQELLEKKSISPFSIEEPRLLLRPFILRPFALCAIFMLALQSDQVQQILFSSSSKPRHSSPQGNKRKNHQRRHVPRNSGARRNHTKGQVGNSNSISTSTFVNRQRIRRILARENTPWKRFQQLKQINGTVLEVHTGKVAIDVTQNVLRIQDFIQEPTETTPIESILADDNDKESSTPDDDAPPKQQEPLNIMLFYADDWTLKVLGALNEYVSTPNIDAMAERGMLFTRNCVTTSVCWISRNSLATGVYAAVHQNLAITSDTMFDQSLPWAKTMYPLLKSNGYYTGLIGKWHAPTPPKYMKDTFDVMKNYYGEHWMERRGRQRHVTDLNGEDALKFLRQRPTDQKFALTVAFYATHAVDGNQEHPYQPMPESRNLYRNVTIPRPQTSTNQHWDDMPWFFTEQNEGRQRWKNRFDTDQAYQNKIRNLYRMASEVDAVVGAIIDELKDQGIYDQTMLIFTTDNGNLHGEHGLAEKWYPFEESIRVPLVIQDPRMPESHIGTRNDDFTLNIDLAPTILSAANIPIPRFMQGRDISQLYLPQQKRRQPTDWRQDFFYEWTQGNPVDGISGHRSMFSIPSVFALIRKDYKYFYWPQSGYEQLFRVETDSFEEEDIVNSTSTTTQQALHLMKARFLFLKKWAQAGRPV